MDKTLKTTTNTSDTCVCNLHLSVHRQETGPAQNKAKWTHLSSVSDSASPNPAPDTPAPAAPSFYDGSPLSTPPLATDTYHIISKQQHTIPSDKNTICGLVEKNTHSLLPG